MPFSEEAANRAVTFISELPLIEGSQWAGRKMKLIPWQEHRVVRPVFGTLKDNGFRQYHTVYIEAPKKSGKTPFAAALGLYLLFADNEDGAVVYFASNEREQAGHLYRHAAGMVRGRAPLAERSKCLDSRKRIVVESTNSYLEALSAEAYSKHGPSIHGIVFDELHALPGRELYDTLTFGTGRARNQQLVIIITTAGFDRNSICWELHEHARKVADGIVEDPTFLPVLFWASENEDWEDEQTWIRCNPSLGYIYTLDDMREDYVKAKRSPADENNFRRFCLNQWTRQDVRWLRMTDWDLSAGQFEESDLDAHVCYGGLDLASTSDLAAFVLVFPPEDEGDPHHLVSRFWCPEDGIRERSRRDKVPYEDWARMGILTPTPGNVVDYARIRADILELSKRFNIREIAYDRWGALQIVQDLESEGLTVFPFGQGYASMGAPTKEFEKLVLAHLLWHGGHPILRWMADNVTVRMDPAGNIKPDKAKSTEKIDGIVAAVMALDRCIRHGLDDGLSVYATRGLITV